METNTVLLWGISGLSALVMVLLTMAIIGDLGLGLLVALLFTLRFVEEVNYS
jgi:hypothetical protein